MTEKTPEDWPRGVERIGLEHLDLLGIDKELRLYWDGKRIETANRLSLTKWQKVVGVGVAAATIVMAALDVLRALNFIP